MKSLIPFLLLMIITSPLFAQEYVVNTTADTTDAGDGVMTLREAVELANNTAGSQTITFDPAVFPIGGGNVIFLDTTLFVTDEAGAVISGAGAEVILDTGKVAFYSGIALQAGNNTIRNMKIRNFGESAILIDTLNSGSNVIGPENEIWNSGESGVLVEASDDNQFIGNHIHDNNYSGIEIHYSSGSIIMDNLLSMNGEDGLSILMGTGNNYIEGNTILGNGNDGVVLYGGKNVGNVIIRNSIGDSSYVPPTSIAKSLNDRSDYLSEREAEGGIRSEFIKRHSESLIKSTESRLAKNERNEPSRKAEHVHKAKVRDDSRKDARSTESTSEGDVIHSSLEKKEHTHVIREVTSPLVSTASNNGNYYNGISLWGVSGTLIEDNLIYGSGGDGIHIEGFFSFIDSSDGIHDTTDYFPYDIDIYRNRFVRNYDSAIEFYDVVDLEVVDNSIRWSYYGVYGSGVYVCCAAEASSSSREVRVSGAAAAGDSGVVRILHNDFAGSTDYAVYVDYLQELYVEDNSITNFYEGVDIYEIEDVYIKNNNFNTVEYPIYGGYIDNLTATNNRMDVSYEALYVYNISNHAEVTDNVITTSDYGIEIYNMLTAVIERNRVDGIYDYGIYVSDADSLWLVDNDVSNTMYEAVYIYDIDIAWVYGNRFRKSAYEVFYASYVDTLYMEYNDMSQSYDDDIMTIRYSDYAYIYNNEFYDSYYGIYLSYVDSLDFGFNEIRNTLSDAFNMYYAYSGGSFHDNRIHSNLYDGVYIYSSSNFLIENNVITLNSGDGMYFYLGSDMTIRNNTILDNGYYGIYSYNGTNIAIDNNFISLNEYGIYIGGTTSGVQHANFNSFFRNFEYGVYSTLAAYDARFNFWGHPDGPTPDGGGEAAAVGIERNRKERTPGMAAAMGGSGDHVNSNVDYSSYRSDWEFVPTNGPAIARVDPPGAPREPINMRGKIFGELFLPGVSVYLDDVEANLLPYYASDVLEFDIPVGFGGPVDVVVVNSLNGTSDTLFAGFFYDNEAPGMATPAIPPNNSKVDSVDVQFGWQNAIDPDGDDVVYTLIYSRAEDFPDSSTVEIGELTGLLITLDEVLKSDTDYFWRVIASDTRTGISESIVSTFKTNEVVIGVDDEGILPKEFSLSQNFPNPFNPSTVINYALPKDSDVKLIIYNLKGQVVENLINGKQNAGYKSIKWNGGNSASGLYIYRLTAGDFVQTRKMVLLK